MPTRRWRLLVLVLVVVLAGAVAGTAWSVRRPVPVVVDPACPPLLRGTSSATDDYGDTVDWHGQTYWRSEDRTRAGEQVGVVTCSISTMPNEQGWSVAQLPWPDGTATVLPRGTTLHLPREHRSGPALVARTTTGDRLYCLVEDGRPWTC